MNTFLESCCSTNTILSILLSLIVTIGITFIFFPAIKLYYDNCDYKKECQIITFGKNKDDDNDANNNNIILSIIIPAYNEEDRLLVMLKEAYEYLLSSSSNDDDDDGCCLAIK